MTSADVRDMLDLPSDGHPRPVKKQKTVEKRPEGITRELFALLGERAPPVAITDHVKYKERPKWSHKVQPWEMIPFTNPAREDGLVLRHWRRKRDPNATAPSATPTDGNEIIPAVPDNGSSEAEFEYYFAKFNVKVNGPRYDEAQYNAHLQSEDWSMAETDYLVHLALDYDLRWIVIADRYDYEPTTGVNGDETSTALVPAAKRRTMEDMKARYYDIAAKIMSLHRPVSTMSAAEFDLHEKMTKFNSRQETDRKRLAEALLSRSLDEIKEEEILLGELKRIVGNEEKFLQERKELYARLESPHSSGNTAMYQSSHGLGQLMQTLLNADKSKKRRSLIGPGDTASSPAVGSSGQNFAGQREGRDSGHRDSIGGSSMKKGSISGSSAQRPLTAKEEE
ncbi:MAG: DNA methyltransferase 1-associated protein 1, partial [Pleopsidium flavum]